MTIEQDIPLRLHTTFKAGGPARFMAVCETEADIREALAFAAAKGIPFYVLGEGSNVLANDEGYNGLIILNRIQGMAFIEEDASVRITAGAGVSWDALVREAAARGLWGIENLAGIPGTVGAAPVQNIGAYGAELAQTLASVEIMDANDGSIRTLAREECAFGYRDSRFKHESHLIILQVSFDLSKTAAPRIEYSDLVRVREAGADLSTPAAIGDAVRAIRAQKFPDLSRYGTAGSFFKNPILTEAAYAALCEKYGDIPRFAHPAGVKIPLAFVLDKILGLRGFRQGNAWLFGAQPLVLVLDTGGMSAEVEALAHSIESKVHDAIGVSIEREVRSLPRR